MSQIKRMILTISNLLTFSSQYQDFRKVLPFQYYFLIDDFLIKKACSVQTWTSYHKSSTNDIASTSLVDWETSKYVRVQRGNFTGVTNCGLGLLPQSLKISPPFNFRHSELQTMLGWRKLKAGEHQRQTKIQFFSENIYLWSTTRFNLYKLHH